jgi:glycosyltransferase involved in cell wall biosynthesis
MTLPQLAIVVIGRNEGERLRRCLDSIAGSTDRIVYVDSGSTDGSVPMAESRGVHVEALDMSRRFSAARARNQGFGAVLRLFADATVVQFVDGDCEVLPDWLNTGVALLESRPDVVAVFGKLIERHPEKSIYNHYAQMTWNPSAEGEVDVFGGNVMARVAAVSAVSGFREGIIDGEDQDLAIRLRGQGGKVWYQDTPMALHDLDVHAFSRWWTRCKRDGYGNGQMVALHSGSPGRPRRRDWTRTWFWGVVLPLLSLASTLAAGWPGLLPLLLYVAIFLRIYLRSKEYGGRDLVYATRTIAGYFGSAVGQMKYVLDRLLGRRDAIIEYK